MKFMKLLYCKDFTVVGFHASNQYENTNDIFLIPYFNIHTTM